MPFVRGSPTTAYPKDIPAGAAVLLRRLNAALLGKVAKCKVDSFPQVQLVSVSDVDVCDGSLCAGRKGFGGYGQASRPGSSSLQPVTSNTHTIEAFTSGH